MRIKSILSGSLALIVLEVIVSSPQTGRLASLFALPATWARWLIDPTIPGIPMTAAGARLPGAAPAAPAATSTATPTPLPGTTRYRRPNADGQIV